MNDNLKLREEDLDLVSGGTGLGDIRIFLKASGGNVYPMQVETADTVESLKHLFTDLTGVEIERQTMVFAGKTLLSGFTLRDYNIGRECTVHVIVAPKPEPEQPVAESSDTETP